MARGRVLRYWILAFDILWACFAMPIAFALRYGIHWNTTFTGAFRYYGLQLVVTVVLWVFLSLWKQLDGFSCDFWLPAIISQVSLGVGAVVVVLLAGEYLVRDYVSRLVFSYFAILLAAGFTGIRYASRMIFISGHLWGSKRRVVIAGSDRVAAELARKFDRHPELLCEVVGFLYPQDQLRPNGNMNQEWSVSTVQTLEIVDLLSAHRVDELILVDTDPARGEVLNLAARCRSIGIEVSLVPHLYQLYLSRPDMVDLGGFPLLRLRDPKVSRPALVLKRTVDIMVGLLLILLASPVVAVAAGLLRARKGKVFRRELRCGHNGNGFLMCRLNVDRLPDGSSKLETVLQQLSISELPNLWNVVRGEMSLVGPRPESLDRVQRYSEWTRQRLSVKPGITGLAQVHGLRDQHSSEEKARFDLQYSLNQSLFTDLSLILQTVWTLCARIFQVPTRPSATGPTEWIHTLIPETVSSADSSQSGTD